MVCHIVLMQNYSVTIANTLDISGFGTWLLMSPKISSLICLWALTGPSRWKVNIGSGNDLSITNWGVACNNIHHQTTVPILLLNLTQV